MKLILNTTKGGKKEVLDVNIWSFIKCSVLAWFVITIITYALMFALFLIVGASLFSMVGMR